MALYMKIPGIKGDVTAKVYEGWIALGSVGFDVNNTIEMPGFYAREGVGACPQLSEFLLGKTLDSATPLLF